MLNNLKKIKNGFIPYKTETRCVPSRSCSGFIPYKTETRCVPSRSCSGFTIVEVLIASFVFSIIAIGISSIFIGILTNERRAFAAQKVEENAMFVLEMMARDIRVSKIENQEDLNCGLTALTITHPVKGTIVYDLNTGIVRKTEGGTTVDISSSAINFTRMNFCVRGSGATDQKQTVVTIISSLQNRAGKETIKFDVQTAVSSRSVETEFLQ